MKRVEMKGKQRWISLAIIGGLLLSCARMWCEATASASRQGTIEDKTGAMIAAATVTSVNKDNGATRTAKTTGAGEYRFDVLTAGTYNVKVTAAGFASAEAKDVEVLIGRTATQNFSLKPGTVTET